MWLLLTSLAAAWLLGTLWWHAQGYWQFHEAVSAVSGLYQGGPGRRELCGLWSNGVGGEVQAAEAALAAEVASPRGGRTGAQGKPNVAIISLYDNSWGWAGSLVDSNRREYAGRWGYTYVNANSLINASRPTAWSKLTAMAHHLPEYDWLLYLDSDALIMNPEVRIEEFLDRRYDFIATNDGNGFNSGAMLVQNTAWSAQWLRQLWDQDHLVTGKNLPFLYEQRAFHALLAADPSIERKHVKYLPPCAFNSQLRKSPTDPGQYVTGDFVLHFAGYHGLTKEVMLCRFVAGLHRSWVHLRDEQIARIPLPVAAHCAQMFGPDANRVGQLAGAAASGPGAG